MAFYYLHTANDSGSYDTRESYPLLAIICPIVCPACQNKQNELLDIHSSNGDSLIFVTSQ